ncbi:hypothetical protein Tco_1319043 [Tanacetum coccineum]
MTSPNKPTSKPSRVAKMSVKPIWRKKPNLCNTSNVLNATSPMPKPLTPHHEPSQENNHPNQALPNPYIKDTTTSPQVVSHPPFPISPINSHVTHTQAPPQKIKAAKPKAITTAATTTTTDVTRPKARGVVVQEPSEFTTTTSQPSQLLQAKDKGKAKMVEPEKPLKKKDQILIDEEITQRLQEELQAELEEEERLARQKEEDANIAEWDNVQAMIDADL